MLQQCQFLESNSKVHFFALIFSFFYSMKPQGKIFFLDNQIVWLHIRRLNNVASTSKIKCVNLQ